MQAAPEFDVIIVGGGMTGASLAIALSAANIRIALVEAVPADAEVQPSYDDRGLALSLSSQRIYQGLQIWEAIRSAANPIEHVHISDQHHFGFVRLHARDLRVPALGYVVPARELGQVLMHQVGAARNIEFICPASVTSAVTGPERVKVTLAQKEQHRTITARLLVAADGAFSRVRELLGIPAVTRDYDQIAIAANVTPGKPHGNTAYERFTAEGPLALLPLSSHRCSVIFTVRKEEAAYYLGMNDAEFLRALQSRFGRRLGTFSRIGARRPYPLQSVIAGEQVRERVAILGNAAHTIHPNGAQGFNLCLRDVAGLVEVLVPALCQDSDPGRLSLLQGYCNSRAPDQRRVTCFADGLTRWFYNELPYKVLARNIGMFFLDVFPPCKQTFLRMGTGFCGRQPALVRGQP
jgi:2-polyprenyl-6-methoxyphenol 4-hydroxylase